MDVEGIDPVAVYAALMSTLVRTVFAQPDAALAWAQHALLSTSGRFRCGTAGWSGKSGP